MGYQSIGFPRPNFRKMAKIILPELARIETPDCPIDPTCDTLKLYHIYKASMLMIEDGYHYEMHIKAITGGKKCKNPIVREYENVKLYKPFECPKGKNCVELKNTMEDKFICHPAKAAPGYFAGINVNIEFDMVAQNALKKLTPSSKCTLDEACNELEFISLPKADVVFSTKENGLHYQLNMNVAVNGENCKNPQVHAFENVKVFRPYTCQKDDMCLQLENTAEDEYACHPLKI